ncbi:MAG: lysophospholipid acyltransferase family protein [Clostridiaceae bacterium]
MRTIYFNISFGLFFVFSIFIKLKQDYILKTKTEKEAQEYLDKWVILWADFCIKRAGISLKVEGKENLPEGNCLFIANHQGNLDIPALIAATGRPMGFIAKKEILRHVYISYWMKKIHCVFIDRENIKESVKAINKGAEYLKEGYNLAVFPEGTRSKGPQTGEFKKGSLKLAIKSGVPIVPVAINGTYKAREANKFFAIKPTLVNVTICKTIIYNELTKEEQSNLAEIVKGIIENNLK